MIRALFDNVEAFSLEALQKNIGIATILCFHTLHVLCKNARATWVLFPYIQYLGFRQQYTFCVVAAANAPIFNNMLHMAVP